MPEQAEAYAGTREGITVAWRLTGALLIIAVTTVTSVSTLAVTVEKSVSIDPVRVFVKGVMVTVEVDAAGVTVTRKKELQSALWEAWAAEPVTVPVTARAQLSWDSRLVLEQREWVMEVRWLLKSPTALGEMHRDMRGRANIQHYRSRQR